MRSSDPVVGFDLLGDVDLSEHPKAAIHEHLKSAHTFRRNVQDIDSSGRVSSLSQHGECLEGRGETANHSLGTTGMVSAKDPRDHASASRDHQRLSARRGCGNMAAGRWKREGKAKPAMQVITGSQAARPAIAESSGHPNPNPENLPTKGKGTASSKPAIAVITDFGVGLSGKAPEN